MEGLSAITAFLISIMSVPPVIQLRILRKGYPRKGNSTSHHHLALQNVRLIRWPGAASGPAFTGSTP
jgi:hypothetical protein